MRTDLYSCFFCSILLLSACSLQQESTPSIQLTALTLSTPYDPEQVHTWLDNAEQITDPIDSNNQRLLALQGLTNPAHLTEAVALRKNMARRDLTPEQANILQLITAKQLLLHHKPQEAIHVLQRTPQTTDTPYDPNLRNWLLSQAYIANKDVEQFIQSALANHSTDPETTQRTIIDTLQHFDTVTREKAASNTDNPTVKAYVAASNLIHQTTLTPHAFQQAYNELQQQYPDILIAAPDSVISTQRIAILLPFQGPLADSSNSILQGILATYYAEHAGSDEAPSLFIENTSEHGFHNTLESLLAKQKIDYVIGPLEKAAVQELTDPPESTTIIALNKPESEQERTQYLYLSPQDETTQLADNLHDLGFHHALVITTNNNWQQKIADQFSQHWRQIGGTVDLTSLDQTSSFSHALKHAFSIDKSEARAHKLARLINENFKFIPNRRHDIDMIFLAASPADARQIKPLLKYYFAGDIPVYAISSMYQTSSTSYLDKDLNDIMFMDSNWYTNRQDYAIKTTLQKIWGQHFLQQKRLYALGHDAYELVIHTEKKRVLPHTLLGATGDLDNHYAQVERQLHWFRFQKGLPTPLA